MNRLAPLFLLAFLTGCGTEPVGTVTGKVTYKAAPVTSGAIMFESADKKVSMSANLGSDGTFTIKSADRAGLPPGEYRVAVSPSKIGSGEAPLAVAPGEAAPVSPIPMHYHSLETSPLKASVKAGENPPFEYDLKDTL